MQPWCRSLPVRASLAAVLVVFLPACGGDGVVTPAPVPVSNDIAAGTAVTVISGETKRPVVGARVVVAGRSYTTDGAGEVRLEAAVLRGSLVDVVAPGYFDRQTTLRDPGPARFALWPKASATGLDEQTTAELVYTQGAFCCPANALANAPLRRVAPTIGSFDLVLDARYGDNSLVRDVIQEAASLAGRAAGARVVFNPADTSGGSRIDITSGPDPENRPNVAAFTEWRLDAFGYITGGRIVFVLDDYLRGRQSRRVLTTIMTHELGHVLGLGHSSAPGVMSVYQGVGTNYAFFAAAGDFSPAEKLVLDLMYDRRGGTRFPDNDRVAALTSGGRLERIVCRF